MTARNGKGNAIEAAPSLVGTAQKAQMVAEFLVDLQQQQFRLELLQTANAADDDDVVPGLPVAPDGVALTYAARRDQIAKAERELLERYEYVLPEVRKLAEQVG